MPKLKNKEYVRYGSAKPAADVDISCIEDYMCDLGPRYCIKCYSRCAYGEKYLKAYHPEAYINKKPEKGDKQ